MSETGAAGDKSGEQDLPAGRTPSGDVTMFQSLTGSPVGFIPIHVTFPLFQEYPIM